MTIDEDILPCPRCGQPKEGIQMTTDDPDDPCLDCQTLKEDA